MYKIMICLNKPENKAQAEFAKEIDRALRQFGHEFIAIRYALVDEEVLAAKPLEIINTSHPKDTVLSVWRKNSEGLESFFELIKSISPVYQTYAVMEVQPLSCTQMVGRVEGMCQLAFLQKPSRLERHEWLDIWLKSHTQIAIDTQSTFSYRQNIIVTREENNKESPSWPLFDAIVEESFPQAAMTDRSVFFNSASDEKRYKENERLMVESCMRFIDFDQFDCIPMSEYIIK